MNARTRLRNARLRNGSFQGGSGAEDISVVGITPSGEVPLVLERLGVEGAEGAAIRIRLPQCSTGPAALRDVQERLREETGYDAAEFVLMTTHRSEATGRRSPTILLAPRLSRVGARPRGLELVPLSELMTWLGARRAAGIAVDPRVPLGILMAERHYPRWALARLQEALQHLRPARPHAASG
jgi:hypothetical protein